MTVGYKNPLTQSTTFQIGDIDSFLNRDDNIMMYMNNEPMPFLMKRSYFANILFDDIVYHCQETILSDSIAFSNGSDVKPREYYHLFKLFANYPEYRDIIIHRSVMDKIVHNRHINKYHIYTSGHQINTIAKSNVDLRTEVEEELDTSEIFQSLSYYSGIGYSTANGYLIRTSGYELRKKLPEYANDIADLNVGIITNLLTCCFDFNKRKVTQCYQHVRNRAVDKVIRDMDMAFIKLAPRTGSQGMILRRGVWNYYPYLTNVGDKMIIENYISTTTRNEAEFGNKQYVILVSPGIPYIKESETFEGVFVHKSEREVLLPKNLLAELIEIEDDDELEYPRHIIRVSLMYDSQFELADTGCKDRTLYHIEPFINRGNYSAKSARSKTRSKPRSGVVVTNSM